MPGPPVGDRDHGDPASRAEQAAILERDTAAARWERETATEGRKLVLVGAPRAPGHYVLRQASPR